jgi:phosphoglycolate phosphatase
MNIDSVIFDLDGTLWDSTDVILRAWNMVIENNDKVKTPITREAMEGIMGLQAHQIGAKLFPDIDNDTSTSLIKHCCEEEKKLLLKEGGILYPELEYVLKTLSHNYPLFIVSNCEGGYIETFLEYHNLGKYFKDIECAGNTGRAKGENIKLIMNRNNLHNSVYVGDTNGDHDAAKLANIPFIFANYGFGEVSDYDYIINKLSDMINLVDHLNKDLS